MSGCPVPVGFFLSPGMEEILESTDLRCPNPPDGKSFRSKLSTFIFTSSISPQLFIYSLWDSFIFPLGILEILPWEFLESVLISIRTMQYLCYNLPYKHSNHLVFTLFILAQSLQKQDILLKSHFSYIVANHKQAFLIFLYGSLGISTACVLSQKK